MGISLFKRKKEKANDDMLLLKASMIKLVNSVVVQQNIIENIVAKQNFLLRDLKTIRKNMNMVTNDINYVLETLEVTPEKFRKKREPPSYIG